MAERVYVTPWVPLSDFADPRYPPRPKPASYRVTIDLARLWDEVNASPGESETTQ